MRFQATINGHAVGYALQKLFPSDPGINGQHFNSAHDGEGFYLTEENGRLIGAYFTHESDGFPTWFTFDCERSGDVYTGPVYLTQGGEMGVPHDPLESVEVGTITFTEGGEPEPPPEPDPPLEPEIPPNPLEGKLTFRLKGFNWHGDWLPGTFYFNERDGKWYLIWSTAQIHWHMLRRGRNTVFEMEITALVDINNIDVGASGYGNPAVRGLPQSMSAGEVAVIEFRLDKTPVGPYPFENADFQINSSLGTLVLYTAHIMGD